MNRAIFSTREYNNPTGYLRLHILLSSLDRAEPKPLTHLEPLLHALTGRTAQQRPESVGRHQ